MRVLTQTDGYAGVHRHLLRGVRTEGYYLALVMTNKKAAARQTRPLASLGVSPESSRSQEQILQLRLGKLRLRSGFRVRTPARLAPRSRPQSRSKCNEALSEDLWPLDPFESAPMRATSSGLCNSIPHAKPGLMEIKDLAELFSKRAGRNSLLAKNFPSEFFPLRLSSRELLPDRNAPIRLCYKSPFSNNLESVIRRRVCTIHLKP